MFLSWMMSCAVSPLILAPDHYWPFSILPTLEILNGIALDAEQIHFTHILLPSFLGTVFVLSYATTASILGLIVLLLSAIRRTKIGAWDESSDALLSMGTWFKNNTLSFHILDSSSPLLLSPKCPTFFTIVAPVSHPQKKGPLTKRRASRGR